MTDPPEERMECGVCGVKDWLRAKLAEETAENEQLKLILSQIVDDMDASTFLAEQGDPIRPWTWITIREARRALEPKEGK